MQPFLAPISFSGQEYALDSAEEHVNWFGLNWTDLILNVFLLAIVPGFLGALGGHLAAEGLQDEKRKRNIKLIFWCMFVVWVIGTIWQQFRAAQSDLAKDTREKWAEALAISKFPPPSPPVLPNLTRSSVALFRFTFVPVDANQEQPIDVVSRSIQNGMVSVAFSAKNVGTAQADHGQIWIQLCDSCKFAEAPEGSTAVPGDSLVARKQFDTLHKGSYFDATTLKIIPPIGKTSFTIALKYACEKCPPIDNKHPQKLRVNIN